METFEKTIALFLAILRNHTGANPKFSIDYQKSEILISYAPSSFIKALATCDKALVSLGENGLSFNMFK